MWDAGTVCVAETPQMCQKRLWGRDEFRLVRDFHRLALEAAQ
jgi:hypothetical protein